MQCISTGKQPNQLTNCNEIKENGCQLRLSILKKITRKLLPNRLYRPPPYIPTHLKCPQPYPLLTSTINLHTNAYLNLPVSIHPPRTPPAILPSHTKNPSLNATFPTLLYPPSLSPTSHPPTSLPLAHPPIHLPPSYPPTYPPPSLLPTSRPPKTHPPNNPPTRLPTYLPYPTLPYLPYPTLPYPTLPYPTLPYPTLPYLPTHLPTHPPTHLPTHTPPQTHPTTHLPTLPYQPYLPTYPPTHLPTHTPPHTYLPIVTYIYISTCIYPS